MNQPNAIRRGLLALGSATVAGVTLSSRAVARPPVGQDGAMVKQPTRPGVTIAYKDDWFGPPWQDAEPILLLHGVAESHQAWQQWVPILSPKFRVIRPDLPGFGQSPMPAGYDCTTHSAASDIVRLMDRLKIERFHLVGAKVGGSTALQLAADFPQRVMTLSVLGTPAKGSPGGKADLTAFPARIRKAGVRAWAAETMPSRLGSDASSEMLAWWTDLMASATPAACIGYSGAAAVMNLEPILGRITAPTLVVTTENSPLQPVASARAYQQMIPKSKLIVLPGDSYHVAAVKPEECARQVLQLIARA